MTLYQEEINKWMLECFGPEISSDIPERVFRFLEEAFELAQALGCTKHEAFKLLDYVFDRPPEVDVKREVGGVMVTLAALCNTHDISIGEAAQEELFRCRANTKKIRAKHSSKPEEVKSIHTDDTEG